MCGRDELPYDKVAIDLAFTGAWRSWAFNQRFTQVSSDIKKGLDGARAMTRAGSTKHVFNLYWENHGRTLSICWRPSWSVHDIDPDQVAANIDGDVPASGWKALAESFLARYERRHTVPAAPS
jgi:hypothetical protein